MAAGAQKDAKFRDRSSPSSTVHKKFDFSQDVLQDGVVRTRANALSAQRACLLRELKSAVENGHSGCCLHACSRRFFIHVVVHLQSQLPVDVRRRSVFRGPLFRNRCPHYEKRSLRSSQHSLSWPTGRNLQPGSFSRSRHCKRWTSTSRAGMQVCTDKTARAF